MKSGVKIVSLTVQDFGALAGKVAIEPFANGITVISGHNETGKSTLVAALRAALFERHDAKHQGIRSLQTHGTTNAPEVWVELDVGGERVTLHKRFLVKPVVELRRAGGGAPELGPAAEETMQALLGGRAPNRVGVKPADMGLWGLLWVTQDAIAHQDPGESLDEDMRGTLWDVVGRQVGQVMGGKHGEHVRTAVLEERARYFTPAGKETGEYKRAKDRVGAAEERVRELEAADAQVLEIARRRRELAEQHEEAGKELPTLETERDEALAEQERVAGLEALARSKAERRATAEATWRSVEKEHDDRRALNEEVDELFEEVTRSDVTIAELARTLARLEGEVLASQEHLAHAKKRASEAHATFEADAGRLELARRREESARAKATLADAVKAMEELEEASRRYAADALDEESMKALEALSRDATTLRARLDREGTRVVVHAASGETIVRAVSVRSRVDVPGLGVLEVEPASSGLASAARELARGREAMRELLESLGVRDVPAARVLREARADREREAKETGERKIELAPKGLEALESEALKRATELAPLEASVLEAAKVDQQRDECAAKLRAQRIDEAALDRLRELEHEVAVARAACDAMGTHLDIVAVRDLRIRSGMKGAIDALAAGSTRTLTVTESTTLLLEDVAELRFEPRGKDLAKSRAKLAQAERELLEALTALGIATVNDAATAATAWRALDDARKHTEQRLAELAPRGLSELHAKVAKARETKRVAEERYAEARAVFARSAQLDVELAHNPATKEQLARLEKALAALATSEATVERLQARVRAVSGPVAEGGSREWAVVESMSPERVAGVAWEIVPGELEESVDAEGAEKGLREALERAGVTDVGAARERFHAGLGLGARIVELRKQVHKLAPDGVAALSARLAAIATDGGATEASHVTDLEGAVDASRAGARAAAGALDKANEEAETKKRAFVEQERAVALLRATRGAKADQHAVVKDKLASVRAVESDDALLARLSAASKERDDAMAAVKGASEELEAATPGLLRDEVARAEGALRSWRDRAGKLRDEAVRLDAHLAMAAASGRYDDLQDARPELEQATLALAKIERDAGAARLLAEVVEEAYRESQRLFLAPVLHEAAPYLKRLRPGTELRMTRDLKLDKVLRRGTEEDFGDLSGGTREQLSVIVRLALARVMARDKRPLPLILDDTMGWTDDGRFLSMVQILRDAASELQIILLTCHPSRFQRFQAERSFDLDALKANPSPRGV